MTEIIKIEDKNILSQIAVLADEIWHECFREILSKEQIDYMVEKFQSYNAMKNQIDNQNYTYFSVKNNNTLCGYFAVKPETDNRLFLSKLYLKQKARGQGIARKMLERVFEEALNFSKKKIYLTVNKYNSHAISVYKKVGFNIIGEPVTDIGNGYVMDDYIMEYIL